MENKRFKASELKPFDMWYCKDRRVLVYLGEDNKEGSNSNVKGSHIWVWADTLMAIPTQFSSELQEYVYLGLDVGYILNHFEDHLSYLLKKISKSQLEEYILLRYKGTPNVVAYIGNLKSPILEKLAKVYTGGSNKNSKSSLKLEPGHLYLKKNKHYEELYLYCGYVNIKMNTYNSSTEKMRHVYMFCGMHPELYKQDLEGTLKGELRTSITKGYSGGFGFNFRKSELEHKGPGCTVNIPTGATWVMTDSFGAIYSNGFLIDLNTIFD